MADLSSDDILKLAALARLDLTDEEVGNLAREVGSILGYVEQLQNVDIAGLDPTNQVTGLTNVNRDDQLVDYGYKPADLLSNVPNVQSDLIKVKRMIA